MEDGQIGQTGQNVLKLETTPRLVTAYVGQGHVIIQNHIMEDNNVSVLVWKLLIVQVSCEITPQLSILTIKL